MPRLVAPEEAPRPLEARPYDDRAVEDEVERRPEEEPHEVSHAIETGLHVVEELTIIVAPVVLGGGKRLFEGFSKSLELEHLGVRQSPFATFIDYRVKNRPAG